MLKRMKTLAFPALFLFLLVVLPASVAAEGENIFTEDFSGDLARWTNPVFDTDAGTGDAGCGDWKVEDGVLRQLDDTTSFAYLSPDRLQAQDFTVTVKARFLKETGDGNLWFGISVRKDSLANEARYNGCNNVMFYLFQNGRIGALRGYPGAQLVDLSLDIVKKADMSVTPGFHTYRLVVAGPLYSLFQDDVLLAELTYEKLQNYGFVSLNSCVARMEFDDFSIEGTETTPLRMADVAPTTEPVATSTPYPSPTPRPTRTPSPSPAPSPSVVLIAGASGAFLLVAAAIVILLSRRRKKSA